MIQKKIWIGLWLGMYCFFLQAQNPPQKFIFPLKQLPELSGNYGEVRPNHFHAGLDFRTHPTEHVPIYAAMNGYVSRIKISAYGYGKVLYLTHPNGLVSVYAHQHHFADKIKNYVENAQEIAQTFEIELFPKPGELPVIQGEVIGYSGNTGGSQGPHLHFEIRDEKTEVPYNPLRFLTIKDERAPIIQQIALYNRQGEWNKLFPTLTKKDTLTTEQPVAFGINCFDYERANARKNNIYKAEIYVDEKIMYRHILDSIPFDLSKYVNTYADYEIKKQKGITIQKLFKDKNNDLPVYKMLNRNGFISFNDNQVHRIKIVVYDFYQQKDEIMFFLKTPPEKEPNVATGAQDCLSAYNSKTNDYSIELPAKSLYRDVFLLVSYQKNTLSFTAKNYNIPFQNACVVKLKVPETLEKYSQKIGLYEIKGKSKNFIDAVYDSGYAKAVIKNFGLYQVGVDTVAPVINVILHKKGIYKKGSTLVFKVSDNFSGIGTFKLFINGKWHLAEYEYKNNTIFFLLDEKVETGKVLLSLQVNDKKNNQAFFQTTILVQ
ncbi:MAG: M23 family metallopeptidase [Bacteroidetes bacterium]|nr:M23 family metallopeptidase [Bacteroidota bacterium]